MRSLRTRPRARSSPMSPDQPAHCRPGLIDTPLEGSLRSPHQPAHQRSGLVGNSFEGSPRSRHQPTHQQSGLVGNPLCGSPRSFGTHAQASGHLRGHAHGCASRLASRHGPPGSGGVCRLTAPHTEGSAHGRSHRVASKHTSHTSGGSRDSMQPVKRQLASLHEHGTPGCMHAIHDQSLRAVSPEHPSDRLASSLQQQQQQQLDDDSSCKAAENPAVQPVVTCLSKPLPRPPREWLDQLDSSSHEAQPVEGALGPHTAAPPALATKPGAIAGHDQSSNFWAKAGQGPAFLPAAAQKTSAVPCDGTLMLDQDSTSPEEATAMPLAIQGTLVRAPYEVAEVVKDNSGPQDSLAPAPATTNRALLTATHWLPRVGEGIFAAHGHPPEAHFRLPMAPEEVGGLHGCGVAFLWRCSKACLLSGCADLASRHSLQKGPNPAVVLCRHAHRGFWHSGSRHLGGVSAFVTDMLDQNSMEPELLHDVGLCICLASVSLLSTV